MEKWFHEPATMLIYTQIAYLLEILPALGITDQFRGHNIRLKMKKDSLFFTYSLIYRLIYIYLYIYIYIYISVRFYIFRFSVS